MFVLACFYLFVLNFVCWRILKDCAHHVSKKHSKRDCDRGGPWFWLYSEKVARKSTGAGNWDHECLACFNEGPGGDFSPALSLRSVAAFLLRSNQRCTWSDGYGKRINYQFVNKKYGTQIWSSYTSDSFHTTNIMSIKKPMVPRQPPVCNRAVHTKWLFEMLQLSHQPGRFVQMSANLALRRTFWQRLMRDIHILRHCSRPMPDWARQNSLAILALLLTFWPWRGGLRCSSLRPFIMHIVITLRPSSST